MSSPLVPVYVPTGSVVHRIRAGFKLVALLCFGIATSVWRQPWQIATALIAVFVMYALARVPPRILRRQLVRVSWIAVPLAAFQWIFASWEAAVGIVGSFVAVVLLAGLVTVTTRTTEMVDVVLRCAGWLRPFGMRPERLGLILALGIRSIHVVMGLADDVVAAQYARGLRLSPRAFAVPLVVRALRHSDRLAEALAARGVDDDLDGDTTSGDTTNGRGDQQGQDQRERAER